jgi:ABC-type branched-subunit amino acid transport system substrate-binding protein
MSYLFTLLDTEVMKMQKIWKATISRRSFLFALATAFLTPRRILAQPQKCDAVCGSACGRIPGPIALVVSLTGYAARIGSEQKKGGILAIEEINNVGGRLTLVSADSQSLPDRAYQAALRSINKDNAKVIIGQIGGHLIKNLASRYPNVIFINLGRETTLDSPPQNAFLLPLDIFERLDSSRYKGSAARCPDSSYAWQAYTAIQLLESAAPMAESGSVRHIVDALQSKRLRTSAGIFVVRSGAFIQQ